MNGLYKQAVTFYKRVFNLYRQVPPAVVQRSSTAAVHSHVVVLDVGLGC